MNRCEGYVRELIEFDDCLYMKDEIKEQEDFLNYSLTM